MRARGSLAFGGGAGVAAFVCILQSTDAGACAVAYPQGTFARFSAERSVVIWDAAHGTEHFVRALSLRGDPGNFGVFVPTPSVPTIAKEDDGILDRIAQLAAPPPPAIPNDANAAAAPQRVNVLPRAQLGDVEPVTLAAHDPNALGAFLANSGFLDKPALREWEQRYLDRKWFITAVRCSVKGSGDRVLDVPTIRLSFKIDVPFFPYTEVPADPADEASFRARYNQGVTPYSTYSYGTRSFDLYVVATVPMQAMLGATTGGPMVTDSVRVTSEVLADALGDTSGWGFDVKSQPTWVITHLSDNAWQRTATSDVTFAPYDLPSPRSGTGVTDLEDRTQAAAMGPSDDVSAARLGQGLALSRRLAAIFLLFLVAGAAAFAVLSEQQKKGS